MLNIKKKITRFALAVTLTVFIGAVENAGAITIDIQPGEIAAALTHLQNGTIVAGTIPPGFIGLTAHVANEKAVLAQQDVVKKSMLDVANRPPVILEAMEFKIMTPLMTTLVRSAIKPKLQQDIAKQLQPGL
jgi:hypothetical protein